MNLSPDPSRAHFVLSSFARSLSHKIRTPLSVLLSDLSYFESQLSGQDLLRTKEKCRDISRLLSVADFLHSSSNHSQQRFDLVELLRDCANDWVREALCQKPCTAFVTANLMLLRKTFESLFRLLEQAPEGVLWHMFQFDDDSAHSRDGSRFCISIFGGLADERRNVSDASMTSLTAFYTEFMGLDCLEPPLIDSALWSQNMDLRVECRARRFKLSVQGDVSRE